MEIGFSKTATNIKKGAHIIAKPVFFRFKWKFLDFQIICFASFLSITVNILQDCQKRGKSALKIIFKITP